MDVLGSNLGLIIKLSQLIHYVRTFFVSKKICKKRALKASFRTLLNFGKRPKTADPSKDSFTRRGVDREKMI